MYKIQIHCYEDAKLMKLFPEIVRALYDQDVLAEDTVLIWYKKGTNPKGRYAFILHIDFCNLNNELLWELVKFVGSDGCLALPYMYYLMVPC